MRLHVYEAGDPAPTTHSDLAGDQQVHEIIEVEEIERVFRVGSDVEIDLNLTIVEAFGPGNHTAIKHSCRDIAVRIDYVGRHFELEHVHPSTSVEAVEKVAVERLQIDGTQAAGLELRRHGTDEVLKDAAPIGAYVRHGYCRIELDLLPVERNQG